MIKIGFVVVLLFTTPLSVLAQSPEVMLCKTWKLVQYEESGTKFPPDESQRNDRMIFKPDHTTQAIESGSVQKGIWKYSPVTKNLEIVDSSTREKHILKVVSLTSKQLVLEINDPDDGVLKMMMIPVEE